MVVGLNYIAESENCIIYKVISPGTNQGDNSSKSKKKKKKKTIRGIR